MTKLFNLIESYNNALVYIANYLKSLDNYVVKSDEENVEKLLRNSNDRIEFEKTIDEMIKNNIKTKDVTLNNKNIKISI